MARSLLLIGATLLAGCAGPPRIPYSLDLRFKLPYADVERLARARATFGLEED